MRVGLLLIFSLVFGQFLQGQAIQVLPAQATFATTDEFSTDSLLITLKNTTLETVQLLEDRLYPIYGQEAFSVNVTQTEILPKDSLEVWVYFSPRHNIFHNSEWLLLTDWGGVRVDLRGQGTFSKGYYQSTENLSEQALKQALKNRLTQGATNLGYSGARNEMFNVIDNQRVNGQGASVNTLEGVYTGFLVTGYSSRTDAQNQGMNTEHTFPQSLYSSNEPMRADLHHLFPTNQNANSARANFPFGNVSNPSWQQGGSKQGNGIFEPRDVQKGPVARAMFYFVLRYQNYNNYLNSQEAVLRQWHEAFPPTDIDRRRNDDIASFQGNRNPLIDYPQFAERIHNFSGNSTAPSVRSFDVGYSEVEFAPVPSGTTGRFDYVGMNSGNEPVQISNIAVSDSNFSFIGSPDTTIQPGEAWVLPLLAFGNSGLTEFTGQLTYNTDVAGQEAQSVPLSANVVPAASVKDGADLGTWQFTPNPTQGEVKVSFTGTLLPQGLLKLLDANGRLVWQAEVSRAPFVLDLQHLPTGLYYAHFPDGQVEKIVLGL